MEKVVIESIFSSDKKQRLKKLCDQIFFFCSVVLHANQMDLLHYLS